MPRSCGPSRPREGGITLPGLSQTGGGQRASARIDWDGVSRPSRTAGEACWCLLNPPVASGWCTWCELDWDPRYKDARPRRAAVVSGHPFAVAGGASPAVGAVYDPSRPKTEMR
ncbi:hypothetical protein [Marivita cryptomonadis]|uniref:hypothetical protein n=1 Tax=Marivita cryptomonadis TaxID=505252 RepID=UPI00391CC7B7